MSQRGVSTILSRKGNSRKAGTAKRQNENAGLGLVQDSQGKSHKPMKKSRVASELQLRDRTYSRRQRTCPELRAGVTGPALYVDVHARICVVMFAFARGS